MKLRILPLFVLLVVLVLVSSCTTSFDYSLTASCEDFADNPNNISEYTLEVGDKIRVELCADPSTGYKWDYEMSVEGVVMEEDHDYNEPEDEADGAAGTEFWTFEAINPGNTEVTMDYGQPGVDDSEDHWTLVMTITVE